MNESTNGQVTTGSCFIFKYYIPFFILEPVKCPFASIPHGISEFSAYFGWLLREKFLLYSRSSRLITRIWRTDTQSSQFEQELLLLFFNRTSLLHVYSSRQRDQRSVQTFNQDENNKNRT